MQTFFGSVWWLIVTLGLLITFHEYGHYVVARHFGVKVLRFSIGFGRPLWSRRDRHGTEFVVAAIPLGGYVKMLDERESDVAPADLAGAHNRKPVLQRMAIAAAGPAFNLIFAIAALWLMFMVGRPDYQPVIGAPTGIAAASGFQAGDRLLALDAAPVETWSEAIMTIAHSALARRDLQVAVRAADGDTETRTLHLSRLPAGVEGGQALDAVGLSLRPLQIPATVGGLAADGAAAAAGVQAGDRILAINDQPVGGYAEISPLIQEQAATSPTLALRIERDGATLSLPATVRQVPAGDGTTRWVLGIEAPDAHDAVLSHGPLAAVPAALAEAWKSTKTTVSVLKRMITGEVSAKNLSGVITIAQVANSSAQMGMAWFLSFLAVISLNLAILNLLPVPVLDGGHLLYYLIELVKGSPVSERAQIAGQYVGLVLLVAMMGLAFYNDILRLAS
ncbi:RIP metalloprotease RseP [Dokdonella koreensis]|uniref:Zinc metalloprotease n=1 Tax=Dokdonella koreensis DS-123 TaxID=1300342 RepID=A0A160DRU7_9GAMM|nr:RIP metalloprotease RseP [Dokdonella koreensis]ANB16947.1 RIP metalloprotease RseP [Dokdonella koreensis DS-123]